MRIEHFGMLRSIPPKLWAYLAQGAVAVLLLCLGVVISEGTAWVGIGIALTVLALFALATYFRDPHADPRSASPPAPELREIERKRKRAADLAVNSEVDKLPHDELQGIARSTEQDARQYLDLHFPRYAGYIDTNRMLYRPDDPPKDGYEHFRNRMRYVAEQLEKATLILGPLEVRQPIVDQLRKAADNVADFIDAREAEEPPPGPYASMAAEVARLSGRIDPTSLDAYRNKTRSLYFDEKHRTEALAAFDAALPFGYTNPEDRAIIDKPNGSAALRLVPEILRRAADRLANE